MHKKNSRTSLKLPKITNSLTKSPEKHKSKSLKAGDDNKGLTAVAYGIYRSDLQTVVCRFCPMQKTIALLEGKLQV